MGISHAAELPRRADLRGDRAAPGAHRQVLHRHAVAHRGHGPGRDRRRGADAPRARVPDAHAADARTCDDGRQLPVPRSGERHMWNPDTIAALQHAVRLEDARRYEEYAKLIDDQQRAGSSRCAACSSSAPAASRSRSTRSSRPTEIVKRFVTGAMSLRLISAEAHETLAIAMNRIGGKSNTGEGGEDPSATRFRTATRAQRHQAGRLRRASA